MSYKVFYSYLTGAAGRCRALIGPQTSLLRERDIEKKSREMESETWRYGTERERERGEKRMLESNIC